ncbi:MAG: diacylglycerol kinase family protein [Gemmatimonadota bacterium]
MPDPTPPSPLFSARARWRSIGFALRGIRTLLVTQHNARIHLVATLVACFLGVALGISRLEWCVVVVATVAVWAAEALNTALEMLCDVASPDFHPLVEKAKDIAAGAVLISALGSVTLAILIFGPRILEAVSGKP